MGNALSAQQEGLNVTGQNVSNVNTPNYVEQSVVLQTATDGGVSIQGVDREFNSFTNSQVLVAQASNSAANARSGALNEAQNVIAPPGGGSIGGQLTSFFSAVQELSASPADTSARSGVLEQADTLAQSFSTAATGLQQQQAAIYGQAQGLVTQVNGDLKQIAQLNSQITQATATGGYASDLETQRDALVSDVATQMGASVVQDPSGSVTLFAGGTALVSGNTAASLGVDLDSSGAMQFTVNNPGGAPDDITSQVTTGALGGLREARDVDIAQSAAQLDQLAYNVATSVNSVQQSGVGLDGVSGRPLFTPPTQVAGAAAAMQVDPSVEGQPNNVAAASSAADLPGGNDVALQLADLANQSIGSEGTPSQEYAALTSQIGNAASAASSASTTSQAMLTQAQNLNSSASGVSLQQEMVNLTQFQQGFQAATQVLQTVNQLLGEFMNQMASVTA
jgi:flagellar hook-associated protein 1 FlgK